MQGTGFSPNKEGVRLQLRKNILLRAFQKSVSHGVDVLDKLESMSAWRSEQNDEQASRKKSLRKSVLVKAFIDSARRGEQMLDRFNIWDQMKAQARNDNNTWKAFWSFNKKNSPSIAALNYRQTLTGVFTLYTDYDLQGSQLSPISGDIFKNQATPYDLYMQEKEDKAFEILAYPIGSKENMMLKLPLN